MENLFVDFIKIEISLFFHRVGILFTQCREMLIKKKENLININQRKEKSPKKNPKIISKINLLSNQ